VALFDIQGFCYLLGQAIRDNRGIFWEKTGLGIYSKRVPELSYGLGKLLNIQKLLASEKLTIVIFTILSIF